jgi:hypothetical protein
MGVLELAGRATRHSRGCLADASHPPPLFRAGPHL